MPRWNKTALQRFEEKIIIDSGTGCWLWTGSKDQKGYGHFWYIDKVIRPTKFSLLHYKGIDIKDNHACHKCDNPSCVNPDHLFSGTALDNLLDCIRKGRYVSSPGQHNGKAKLTEEQVLEIRSSNKKIVELAKIYNVTHQSISDIKLRKKWKHLQSA